MSNRTLTFLFFLSTKGLIISAEHSGNQNIPLLDCMCSIGYKYLQVIGYRKKFIITNDPAFSKVSHETVGQMLRAKGGKSTRLI